jgi:predicted amidohydrolase YtcJ
MAAGEGPMSRSKRPTILRNARIVTMADERPRADAVAFTSEGILCVGTEEAVIRQASSESRVLDAGGRTVIPGFIDCHTHFLSMGVWMNRLDLYGCKSQGEVLLKVARRARKMHSGKWILGRGWDESMWNEARFIDRRDIDSASPRNPVMLIRVDGHMAAVNSFGLDRLKRKVGPKGVDAAAGHLKEAALEKARHLLRPGPKELAEGMKTSLDIARRLGVTSVHDIIDIDKLRAYEAARRRGILTVRACLHLEKAAFLDAQRNQVRPGGDGRLVRIGGMKLYADGSLGARTAAVRAPYADTPSEHGALLMSEKGLTSHIRDAERKRFQLLIHAIGDRAVAQVIFAFSSVLSVKESDGRCRTSSLRHRIEHLELVTASELALMRKLGLMASMQPNFVGEWGAPGGMMQARLGKRYEQADPFRRVLDAGVPLVFGSDCMPFSPLFGIHSAVNAPFPAQRIGVNEALAAYTRTAAAASFEEGFKGALAPRMAADMAVLSDDLFRNPSRIDRIRVDATIFDGRLIWRRRGILPCRRL